MKKFLSILFLFVFVFALASCEQGQLPGGGELPGGGTQDGDKVEITFWHAMGQANQTLIDRMIASFTEKYPNVSITQSNQGGYPDLLDKIKNNIKAGTGPTIAQTYPDHVVSYLNAKGAVVDLNTYAYDDELGFENQGIDEDLYVKSFWDENTRYDAAGSIYSLPFNKSTEIVFYNQDIFEKYDWFVTVLEYNQEDVYSKYAPVTTEAGLVTNEDAREINGDFIWHPTWQELVKIGAAFKDTVEYKAFVDDKTTTSAFSYDSQANLFITLTQQFAAMDENDKYGALGEEAYTSLKTSEYGEFTFLNPENPYAKQAVNFYKENYDKGYFATSGTLGVNYSSDAFKAGQCVVTIGSSAGASYNNPGTDGFKVGVATYPQLEGTAAGEEQVIQQGTNLTLFSQIDKEVEKYGWLFMLHMIDYQQAYDWCTGTSYFPIRSDVYESQEYQEFVEGITRVNGEIVKKPTLGAKAAKVGWMQKDWFYTNVVFAGTDVSRAEIETLFEAVLLNTATVDAAFSAAETNLKNYIIK